MYFIINNYQIKLINISLIIFNQIEKYYLHVTNN